MKKIIAALSFVLISNQSLKAQDGVLDNTFGTGGKVSTSFIRQDEINDIAIQADGKIVAVGICVNTVTTLQMISVARYNSNGSLDNSFGTNGLVTTTVVANFDCSASAVKLQTDGKIVVGGQANDTATTAAQNGRFLILRYNTNGTLDNTFATNGIFSVTNTSTVAPDANANDLVIQTDGKIVLCGYIAQTISSNNLYFIRVNTNGSFDNTFGTNGIANIVTPLGQAAPTAMVLQADGKIAFSGFVDNTTTNSPFVSRLNTNGSIDQTFGSNGFVQPSYSSSTAFLGIAIDAAQFIYTCGVDNNGSVIAKFNSTGAADATYGNAGHVITSMSTAQNETLNDLVIQSDGKVVAAGDADGHFAVMRTLATGSLDLSFGTTGVVTTTFTSGVGSEARSIKIQADGKIVLGGINITANITSIFENALARYTNASTTALSEVTKNDSFELYPNPTADLINLNTLKETNGKIRIYNASGQLVRAESLKKQIDVSELPNGVYQISIDTKSNVLTKKLVIQH